jgi:chromosome partitioning protein
MEPMFFAFANQKGGVGKTTLAVHLAIHAHNMGLRTLLVDLDQQGSSTFLLTGDGDYHQTDMETALDLWYPDRSVPLQESPIFGFDFLQASAALDVVDDDLDAAIRALRRLLVTDSGQGPYHVVVIDCPPAPGVRQMAPLFVAHRLVIPVTPDALGTQGLTSMIQLGLTQVRPVNPHLEIQVLINRLKANSPKNRAIASALQERFPDWVLPLALFEREDVRTGLRLGKPYWEVCRDAEQKDAWYQTFDGLLDGVGGDEEDGGKEVEAPDNAEEILAQQEANRGGGVS